MGLCLKCQGILMSKVKRDANYFNLAKFDHLGLRGVAEVYLDGVKQEGVFKCRVGADDGWVARYAEDSNGHRHMCERIQHNPWNVSKFGPVVPWVNCLTYGGGIAAEIVTGKVEII